MKPHESSSLVATYDQQLAHVVEYLRPLPLTEINGLIDWLKRLGNPPEEVDLDQEDRFRFSVMSALANLGLMLAMQKIRGVGEFGDTEVE